MPELVGRLDQSLIIAARARQASLKKTATLALMEMLGVCGAEWKATCATQFVSQSDTEAVISQRLNLPLKAAPAQHAKLKRILTETGLYLTAESPLSVINSATDLFAIKIVPLAYTPWNASPLLERWENFIGPESVSDFLDALRGEDICCASADYPVASRRRLPPSITGAYLHFHFLWTLSRKDRMKTHEELIQLLQRLGAKLGREYQRNREIALGYAPRSPIPDEVKIFVWQRDQGKCVRCGSNVNLEFDHVIPICMGGSNTARNLQLLCELCNREKGGSL